MSRERKAIRATAVLDYLESKWKEYWYRSVGFAAADKIGKESAEFGTRVHRKIESILLGEGSNGESATPEDLCAQEVILWLDRSHVFPLFGTWKDSLEIEVQDKKLGLIGHFDMAATIDGMPCIVDFKTSNKMRKSFPLQKAAYAKMANKQLGVDIDYGVTVRSHWNKEAKKVEFEVKTYENLVKKYWPIFKSGLEFYKYMNYAEDK